VTTRRKLAPRRAAEETLELLRRHANKTRAASYQRYFKEPVAYFGLDMKGERKIKDDLLERVEGSWTIQDAVRFCNVMVRDPHMEARGMGYQIVAHFLPQAPPALLKDVKRWLEKSCGNWGLVDSLAPSVLAPLLDRYPELIPEVVSWTDVPSPWVRRGAAVAFVPLVSKGKKKHVATAYRIASRLLGDEEDLIHKAVGWLLREAGKSDMKRLETFLIKNGPGIPRTSVRYAIERFPARDRKRLLAATKGEGNAPGKRKPQRR
jgi:3-methyladenine DNA glycosylase AlkD